MSRIQKQFISLVKETQNYIKENDLVHKLGESLIKFQYSLIN